MKKQFQLDAKLLAVVDDMKNIGELGADLIAIPGHFRHPMHGEFELGFIGEPPMLVIMHPRTRKIGYVQCQPMLEALGKEIVKVLHG